MTELITYSLAVGDSIFNISSNLKRVYKITYEEIHFH